MRKKLTEHLISNIRAPVTKQELGCTHLRGIGSNTPFEGQLYRNEQYLDIFKY